MRDLNVNEVNEVSGGVDQSTVISSDLGIVAIGVGIMVAGATAPAWFPLAMIAVVVGLGAAQE